MDFSISTIKMSMVPLMAWYICPSSFCSFRPNLLTNWRAWASSMFRFCMAAFITASKPVGMALVSRGASPTTTTRSVARLPMSSTIWAVVESAGITARASAMLSGSKAITFRPMDSNISSRFSTYSLDTLLSNTSTFVLSAGESPSSFQSIFDSASGVGISESAWYWMLLPSSSADNRSMSTTVVNTRWLGRPTATFLVFTPAFSTRVFMVWATACWSVLESLWLSFGSIGT